MGHGPECGMFERPDFEQLVAPDLDNKKSIEKHRLIIPSFLVVLT